MQQIVTDLKDILEEVNLPHLLTKFENEAVTMEMLLEMDERTLNECFNLLRLKFGEKFVINKK